MSTAVEIQLSIFLVSALRRFNPFRHIGLSMFSGEETTQIIQKCFIYKDKNLFAIIKADVINFTASVGVINLQCTIHSILTN